MEALKKNKAIPVELTEQHGNDAEFEAIFNKLKEARFHIRLNRSWNNFLYSLMFALALIVITELAFRIVIFDNRRILEILALILIPLLAALWPFIQKISDLKCARMVDLTFGTKERLSTAVEIKNQTIQSRFDEKVVGDAARITSSVNLTEGFSYRPSNRSLALFAALIIPCLILLYLPNAGDIALVERKAFVNQLESEKKVLEQKRADIEQNTELGEGDKEELLKKIDELIAELSKKNITREEAVAKIDELQRKMEEKKPAWGKGNDDLLQRLARQMSDDPALEDISHALKNRDYKRATGEVDALSPKLAQLNASEKGTLSAKLNQMATSASSIDPQLAKALSELSKALNKKGASDQETEQAASQLSEAMRQAGNKASLEKLASDLSNQLSQSRQSVAQAGQAGKQSQQPASSGQNSNNQNANSSGAPPHSNRNSMNSQNNGGRQGNGSGQNSQNGQNNSGNQGSGNRPGQSSSPGSSGNSGQGNPSGGGAIGANPSARQGTSSSSNDFGNTSLDRERKRGSYKSVYAPDLISADTQQEKLTGQTIQGDESYESVPMPPAKEEALIPYSQAYYHYYDTAIEALNRGEIPPNMEGIVKNYFDAMRPE